MEQHGEQPNGINTIWVAQSKGGATAWGGEHFNFIAFTSKQVKAASCD